MLEKKGRRQPAVRAQAKEASRKCNFYLPQSLVDRLHDSAERSRRRISAELTVILEQYFAAQANDQQTGKVA